MYLAVVDAPAGLMVARQASGGNGAEDGTRMVAAVHQLGRLAVWPGRPKVYVLYVERDAPHPGPIERDQIAEAWRRIDCPATLFCVVSESAIVRATFDLLLTLRRTPRRAPWMVVSARAEALAWLETMGRRGVDEKLGALEDQLQKGMSEGSGDTVLTALPTRTRAALTRRF